MADTLGKYELLSVLGKGAMGTVYEGFDPVIHRRLAIKTVKLPETNDFEAQEELARFRREAQAAGRLSHINIVGVFDYGETPDLAFIVMEFVDGTTLKHVLDKKERFEIAEIVRIMDGLLTGLQYSHDRGVVHRDIKPANIMMTKAGEVKIADFGIARIESSSMTQAGTMLGTPSYMSPEQFMGQTVDARTDIFSSAVMLYQLLTGEKPFEGGLTAIMHKVLNTEPPPPSALSVSVPASFDAVVKRAMAKRPEERFGSATEFAQALKNAFAGRDGAEGNAGMAGPGDADATMIVTASRPRPGGAAAPGMIAGVAANAPASGPASAVASGPASAAANGPASAGGSAGVNKQAAPRKSLVALIAGGAALIATLGGAAFFMLGHGAPTQPAPVASHEAAAATTAAAAAAAAATAMPVLTAAQRETTLSSTLASLPCTFLSGDDSGAKPTLAGMAGAGTAQAALAAAIGSLPGSIVPVSTVQTVNEQYCDALNTIRPYHDFFPRPGLELGLHMAKDATILHNNELITVDNVMPGFAGYLQTDYFSEDGSVFHLYPTPTDKLRQQPAGSVKSLGNPQKGGARWQVSAPFGPDMIISIVTSEPLFPIARPQVENASDYLPALRQALQNAASSGGNLSVAALQVITEK